MKTLIKGQTLSSTDLFFYVLDGSTYVDPYYITYTIYKRIREYGCCWEPINETIESVPVKFGIGKYFAAWEMPKDIEVGDYQIKWIYQLYDDTQKIEVTEDFNIVVRSCLSSDANGKLDGDVYVGGQAC